ncbi:MAG: hypothetical protein K0R53_3458 [Burkholderiales bacterium]|nr:hypothetical protein [Burkholderiales bacterium]
MVHVIKILHGHRHAHERAEIVAGAEEGVYFARVSPCLVRHHVRVCAEFGIESFDAAEEGVCYVIGRNLASP